MTTRRNLLAGGAALAIAGASGAYYSMRQMGSMDEYDASVAETRATLSERPTLRELVRYATLAANGHNTQPWRFRVGANRIEILPDLTRRTPVVDPDNHHLFASLGCAAENLALCAVARGHPTDEISYRAENGGAIAFAFSEGPAIQSVLFDAIPQRQSTRAEYQGGGIDAADLRALAAANIPGVDVIVITDRLQMDRVRDLVIAGNTAQMADAAFMRELKSWLRFSPRQAIASGDGLFAASSGNPALPDWLGPHLFDLAFRADAENDKYARQLRSLSGIAVFVSEQDDPDHWVRAGRACQRFALQVTALGLKQAFINQPVEIAHLRPELAALVGMPGRRPDIVMRFGRGPTLPYSPRRPMSAVLA